MTDEENKVYKQIQEQYANKIILVGTKADAKINAPYKEIISISSKNKQNIDSLEQLIEQKIATLFAGIESPFLLNQRQHNLLVALENKLVEIILMLNAQPVAYELLSIHLNDAIAHLAELSGKQISEAGMDMIFREFCIGK